MPRPPMPPRYFEHFQCDMRLPNATLAFRLRHVPPLTTLADLSAMNMTAWLYRNRQGVELIQVNPNITIAQLRRQFGSPESPDVEVGFHSEMQAAEWFRLQATSRFQVLQIFTERSPCDACAKMLRTL